MARIDWSKARPKRQSERVDGVDGSILAMLIRRPKPPSKPKAVLRREAAVAIAAWEAQKAARKARGR